MITAISNSGMQGTTRTPIDMAGRRFGVWQSRLARVISTGSWP
jgi:hypothetical protein